MGLRSPGMMKLHGFHVGRMYPKDTLTLNPPYMKSV